MDAPTPPHLRASADAVDAPAPPPTLRTVLREWGRIGCIGFGGPPAHIALLRDLVVERRRWMREEELEDAIAACNLLPGPASTQLAIFCAWRLGGARAALVGGLAFILPGLVAIIALAALVLGDPPGWVRGLGAGAGAVVAAVALDAALRLLAPGWRRATDRLPFAAYVLLGGSAAALAGPWVVLVLLACGAAELLRRHPPGTLGLAPLGALLLAAAGTGGLLALSRTALKVGALSYGGGFVIIPLMRADAVDAHGWMTDGQFLNAVALGQATPGPVVQTVAVVGYAAQGLGGALLAALVAFAPSFSFVLLGGDRFDRLRGNLRVRAFLDEAGPAAIGAIGGTAVPLALALAEPWQVGALALGGVALALGRGVLVALALGAATGVAVALAGGPT